MSYTIEESKRCLQCKRPSCRTGCPANTDVPKMIEYFLSNRIDEAGQMLFDSNPLSAITSLVCDHMNQCEGNCILQNKARGVHIGNIEHYISERFLERYTPEAVSKLGKRVAVVGSGPAGLTISVILARRGYDVTVFDSRERIGGVLRYGIPEFRLPKKLLDRYAKLMKTLGIHIRPNTTIGRSITVDNLFRDGYLAVFIGTGVWKPSSMDMKGVSLGNVHFAIDYLTSPQTYALGDTVSIIGAGNSAMDVARTVLRQGSRNVTIYSRSPVLKASPTEIEFAKVDGVHFQHSLKPIEITPDGIIFRKMTYAEDESVLAEYPESDSLYPSDSVIIAIGQGPKSTIVNSSKGIETDGRGLVITSEQGETTRSGVFASGDVVSGAKTVVEAVQFSKGVADAMDTYMQGLGN